MGKQTVSDKLDEIDKALTDYINTHYYDGLSTALKPGGDEASGEHEPRERGKTNDQRSEPRDVRWWRR